jgi:hypothetical protein
MHLTTSHKPGKLAGIFLMKRRLAFSLGLSLVAPFATEASVISFHNANQGYSHYGGYNVLMYGQGAASDPGNNVWNGFGRYGGPGSTDFYGGGNPDSNSNNPSVPAGLPGQPYAWYTNGGPGTSASGTNLFSPTNSGASNTGNAYSDGTISPITLNMSYDSDNGANGGTTQGSPSWILSHAALVSGTDVGTFTLSNVPAGSYDLFLYGANFDGTRGAAFTVSSGTALDGISSTNNPNANPTGSALNSYVLGQDYVEFIGVTPSGGTITGTWSAVTNTNSGLGGEGDFNGLQLVSTTVPEPTSMALLGLPGLALLARRRRMA